jgi:hypothetical protein
MSRQTAGIDANDVKSLLAVSSVDGQSIVVLWADPVTHALLVKTVNGGIVSSGFQIPTGTVNGTNRTFIWTVAPNAIVVDGATLQQTEQGGQINWTGTTTTVMTVAPTESIFGVA